MPLQQSQSVDPELEKAKALALVLEEEERKRKAEQEKHDKALAVATQISMAELDANIEREEIAREIPKNAMVRKLRKKHGGKRPRPLPDLTKLSQEEQAEAAAKFQKGVESDLWFKRRKLAAEAGSDKPSSEQPQKRGPSEGPSAQGPAKKQKTGVSEAPKAQQQPYKPWKVRFDNVTPSPPSSPPHTIAPQPAPPQRTQTRSQTQATQTQAQPQPQTSSQTSSEPITHASPITASSHLVKPIIIESTPSPPLPSTLSDPAKQSSEQPQLEAASEPSRAMPKSTLTGLDKIKLAGTPRFKWTSVNPFSEEALVLTDDEFLLASMLRTESELAALWRAKGEMRRIVTKPNCRILVQPDRRPLWSAKSLWPQAKMKDPEPDPVQSNKATVSGPPLFLNKREWARLKRFIRAAGGGMDHYFEKQVMTSYWRFREEAGSTSGTHASEEDSTYNVGHFTQVAYTYIRGRFPSQKGASFNEDWTIQPAVGPFYHDVFNPVNYGLNPGFGFVRLSLRRIEIILVEVDAVELDARLKLDVQPSPPLLLPAPETRPSISINLQQAAQPTVTEPSQLQSQVRLISQQLSETAKRS